MIPGQQHVSPRHLAKNWPVGAAGPVIIGPLFREWEEGEEEEPPRYFLPRRRFPRMRGLPARRGPAALSLTFGDLDGEHRSLMRVPDEIARSLVCVCFREFFRGVERYSFAVVGFRDESFEVMLRSGMP